MSIENTLASVGMTVAQTMEEGRQKAHLAGYEGDEAEEYAQVYVEGFATALLQERERCCAIICCGDAKGRLTLALTLATETDLSVEAARAILRSTAAQAEPKAGKVYKDQFAEMMAARGLLKRETDTSTDDDAEAVIRRARARDPHRH